jgi:hypothetical protein
MMCGYSGIGRVGDGVRVIVVVGVPVGVLVGSGVRLGEIVAVTLGTSGGGAAVVQAAHRATAARRNTDAPFQRPITLFLFLFPPDR